MTRVLQTAWAPVAVLGFSFVIGGTSFAREVWWLLHVVGGVALGFFFLDAVDALDAVRPAWRYVAVFALACTAALAWELLEFAIDQVLRTRLQESLADTMSDLMFGVCGVALYLAYTAFTRSRG
ncbi:MAG TPA: hypothetical protein VFK84_14305 [Burkholderiales bacterium]|nr:hypothetical protein [Burkholderiales bacterium]